MARTPLEADPRDLAALAEPLVLLPTKRRRLTAPNRIVYQPMEGNDAEPDGAPSEATFRRYRDRAAGRAGLDLVEAVAVSRAGRARERQLVLTAATRPAFEELVARYRRRNDATPLLVQLTHSGRFALDPVTPYPLPGTEARLLTDGDLLRIRDDLLAAVRLAYEAGFDGIDFKHCHGYLFGALLGPANRARPGWTHGGETLAERARFCRETLARMREIAPPDRFLYTVRLSAFEGIPGGFGSRDARSEEEDETRGELVAFCRMLEAAGVHLLNQTSGVPELTPLLVRQTRENPLGFFDHQERAEAMKRAVSIPVVGSGYSYASDGRNRLPGDRREKHLVALAGRALREGRVDLIGIGRQSLADPHFADKVLSGRLDEVRWDTACNRCADSLRSHRPVICHTYEGHLRRRE